jgi:tripartite-type tricarboxylate transporter receptor subunit TctC
MTFTRALVAALLAGFATAAAAQSYPAQPIRMISPFPPGGSVDITARLIAEPMAKALGGRIYVEDVSGASGNIGMEQAARAKPDGATIVLNTIPLVTNKSLFKDLSWDPIRDFAPIGMVATSPHLLVVPLKNPAKSVADLLKDVRAHPGKLSYASAG